MPFKFENTGATYQRLMNNMFSRVVGNTMEVFVDDIVVKSNKSTDHAQALTKAFEIMENLE